MKINLSSFFQGILGGVVGGFILFLLLFGFFSVSEKLRTISLTCEKEKINSSRSVECQVLEIKDLGNTLKTEDIVSPVPEPEKEILTDIETTGKFVQVKYKIKNERKEPLDVPFAVLVDKIGREYRPRWQSQYWIPEEYQASYISPGFEKEITEIFEVSKNSQEPFKIKLELTLPHYLD